MDGLNNLDQKRVKVIGSKIKLNSFIRNKDISIILSSRGKNLKVIHQWRSQEVLSSRQQWSVEKSSGQSFLKNLFLL
jgi:hypothetical protein